MVGRLLASSLVLALVGTAFGQTTERVFYDAVDAEGSLTGGSYTVPRIEIDRRVVRQAKNRVFLLENGPPANRIDIVCLGDGFTEDDLDAYAVHVDTIFASFFDKEPLRTYARYFNVHRIDVVSPESGVDHDPEYGILRDTALDMGFYCKEGVPRSMCIDIEAAYAYAGAAPDADQILALANSGSSGGSAYLSSDIIAMSGGLGSGLVDGVRHEFGHILGELADEYFSYSSGPYAGPEPGMPNISVLDAEAMRISGGSWAAWLDEPAAAYDGPVGTYEGAFGYPAGIYRPTGRSLMRSLYRPFNPPSVESLVIEIYRIVRPADDSTPADAPLAGGETVWVTPVRPVGHDLDLQWFLDGEPIVGGAGTTMDLASLDLRPGDYRLSVSLTDNTELVRDEQARAEFMSQDIVWDVHVPAPAPPTARLINAPNPCNPVTTFHYDLTEGAAVDLRIYDLSGRMVRTLLAGSWSTAGTGSAQWDGCDDAGRPVASGSYVCRLQAGETRISRSVVLIR